ncbi:MAG: M23 family metallopeptidase [Alphaproteobacteria bacterium]|nr:M23 family metallopeptidase [Alphaproteobacteria bacterium]
MSLAAAAVQGTLVVGRATTGASVTVDGNPVLVSPKGLFAFGISYDRDNPVHVEWRTSDGTVTSRDVDVIARQYETQTLTGLPQQFVTPTPEQVERIKREAATIYEARKRETDGVGFSEPFDWPVPGIISSVYGSRRILNGIPSAPHLGIDIAAAEGTPIKAPADGIVAISDDYFLDGGFTLLDHGHGVSSCYLHQSKRMATAGAKVSRGDVLGLVGRTGRATGPHVHWGLCWFQVKLDPSRSTRTPEPARA